MESINTVKGRRDLGQFYGKYISFMTYLCILPNLFWCNLEPIFIEEYLGLMVDSFCSATKPFALAI